MFIFKKYIAVQHFWVGKIKKRFFKVCNAHQGCIYLINNTVKTQILWYVIIVSNNSFLF